MKVVFLSKSDALGGAAVVTVRLMMALRKLGVDAKMLVAEKTSETPGIETAAGRISTKYNFLAERLRVFIANGFNRADLFRVDLASDGVKVWNHPWVKEADVVVLSWVNQGFVSLNGVKKMAKMGKPIVWMMHDMWNMTGICHHAGDCHGYLRHCGNCHFLGKNRSADDASAKVWKKKHQLYEKTPIRFVAVSNWLAGKARESGLMKNADLMVIPNPFPVDDPSASTRPALGKCTVVMGAARLDDPIKGLPILVKTTKILAEKYPEIAKEMELVTFGDIRDMSQLEGIAIAHRHIGKLKGEGALRRVYDSASIVVSPSLFETLPGTLVEGQAYGCLPVAFDHGGQSDIISHKRTGYLCSLPEGFSGTDVYKMREPAQNEAAEQLCEGLVWAHGNQSDEIRERMKRSVIDRFSDRAVARRYLQLFQALIDG